MDTRQVQNIIWTFFGKRFSKDTQLRFRYWLRSADAEDEKEAALQEIWERMPMSITECTLEDLSDMQKRISYEHNKSIHRSFLSNCWKYAAVLALIFSTSIFTLLVGRSYMQMESPEMVEFYVPYGDCREVVLSDGSTVWVNAGSLLIYPSEFTSTTRKVYLNGEARFQVAKNPDKAFIVGTNHLDIQALGTIFSVCAYPNSKITGTTLEEGSIRVRVKADVEQSSILSPGEQLVYNHNTHDVQVNRVDAKQMSAWADGYLIFENASFEQIVITLERKYNVAINYDANKYKGSSYFVKFNPNESIEEALAVLSRLIDGFKYSISGQTIVIN